MKLSYLTHSERWSFTGVLVLLALVVVLVVPGCGARDDGEVIEAATAEDTETAEPAPVAVDWALAIHGGAGVIERNATDPEPYYQSLAEALTLGRDMLASGSAALEVVESVVRFLEDDPKFNAGRGAVFTNRGTHELDAAIMDGRTLSCGSVAGVRNVRNPITLARRVMERSPHVFMAGDGADEFSKTVDVARVRQSYFFTQKRHDDWQKAVREERRRQAAAVGNPGRDLSVPDLSTVGAVALDRYGNLAAGTSTGGMTNKRFGRVGDVPVIGAGTYANNQTAAISGTGKGEQFIRHTVAHDISARIEYGGRTAEEAAREVIDSRLEVGDGGVIVVDRLGSISMVFNTPGMFRGAANSEGRFDVGIWQELRGLSPPATDSSASPADGSPD
jgi:beta-aspartyl-peptidase (threonine type)